MSGVTRAWASLKDEGPASAAWRTANWLLGQAERRRARPGASVYADDVAAVDWTRGEAFNAHRAAPQGSGYRTAWLITPPSAASGGHQNAFRFMRFLEEAGHEVAVFLYAPARYPRITPERVRALLDSSSGYPSLRGAIHSYDPQAGLPGTFDAVVATSWETAYAAFRHGGTAKRLYFVQDFEADFYAAGTDRALAENTYRFGFHGLTAGRWLAEKLGSEYGMQCDPYDFAVDTGVYRLLNRGGRDQVVCYVRPPTPRRASEFALLALRELHRIRPGTTVNLVGWPMPERDVPFPFVGHGALSVEELNGVYNRCAAGLSLSLTNASLAPKEMLAAGVVPVVNDAPNTRRVLGEAGIAYAPMSPRTMAERLAAILENPDAPGQAARAAASVSGWSWSESGRQFVEAFDRVMRAGE